MARAKTQIKIDTRELVEACKNLDKYDADVQDKARKAVQSSVRVIARRARANITPGGTGNLRKGIKVVFDPRVCSGIAKSTAPHSHLVEYGRLKGQAGRRFTLQDRKSKTKIKAFKLPWGPRAWFTIKPSKPRPFLSPAFHYVRPKYMKKMAKALEGQGITVQRVKVKGD